MSIEELKETARRHEQKEEWQKALNLYRESLSRHDEDEPPDPALLNRIGDLQTRLGHVEGAVKAYEECIDLYMEAELPNNAIAVCKKVLRNLPDRDIFVLRMGQIRGEQGFLTDARQNFLTFAERRTEAGEIDEAMDALVELVDLVPDDLDIRLALASQLESHEREEEAVEQYTEAYRHLILDDREEEARDLAARLEELAPYAELPDPESVRASAEEEADQELRFESTSLAGMELGVAFDDEEEAAEGKEEGDALVAAREPGEEPEDYPPGIRDEPEEIEEPLPTLEYDEPETAEVSGELPERSGPSAGMGDEDVGEEEPLPTFELQEEEGEALPGFGFETGEFEAEEEGEAEEEELELPRLDAGDEEDVPAGERREEAFEEAAREEVRDGDVPAAEEVALEEETAALDVEEVPTEAEEIPGIMSESPPVAERPPSEADAVAEAPKTAEEAAEAGDLDLAIQMISDRIEAEPDEVEHYQRLVEFAFRTSDQSKLVSAYIRLAGCLARTGSPAKAKAVYQQVVSLSPGHEEARTALAELEGESAPEPRTAPSVTSSEDYVDLGSMILGEEGEKTTRWTVAADAPSGDEDADFARMLNQFKEKVSQNVDAGDVAAHHDLGTAYMEMGLLDEAIGEFQMALRASPDHLPTYEVLGRCWMEMDKPEMVVRSLERALGAEFQIEDELIGIYYLLGRAKEALGNHDEAAEFYEKVFSLDINFEDVTERLRTLR